MPELPLLVSPLYPVNTFHQLMHGVLRSKGINPSQYVCTLSNQVTPYSYWPVHMVMCLGWVNCIFGFHNKIMMNHLICNY